MKNALEELKQYLMENGVVQLPDHAKTYVLELNSSDYRPKSKCGGQSILRA